MYEEFRLKMGMLLNVVVFCAAHPSDIPKFVASFGLLKDAVARLQALGVQQTDGLSTVSASANERMAERDWIERMLNNIVRIGFALGNTEPAFTGYFKVPRSAYSIQAFLNRARTLIQKGREHLDRFADYGFTAEAMDQLEARVAHYGASFDEGSTGRQAHVGARREIQATLKRAMILVDDLDAINQLRFQDDADALGAWTSARNIAWKAPKKPESEPGTGTAIVPLN